MKLFQRQLRIIPVTQALTVSGNPNFADAAWLQCDVPLRIHDLNVETGERSSTTDNLRSRADFGDLGRHAGLPYDERMLVDGNDIAASERNRQGILGQPVGGIEALRLESVGLKCLQKPRISIRLYGLRRDHEHADRTEVAIFETLLGNSPGTQAIVVSEVGGCRGGSLIGGYRIKPQNRALNEVRGRETVRRAALQGGIKIATNQSHIVILRKPGDDYRRGMIDHERRSLQDVFVRDNDALGLHRRPGRVLEKQNLRGAAKRLVRNRIHEIFGDDPRKPGNAVDVDAGGRDSTSGEIGLQ